MKRLPLIACLLICACAPKEKTDEQLGASMLNEARELLSQGNTTAARDTILSMRQRYPHAFRVRRAAILTMDSIELQDAITTGDSLKQEFFRRKLRLDLDNTDIYARD